MNGPPRYRLALVIRLVVAIEVEVVNMIEKSFHAESSPSDREQSLYMSIHFNVSCDLCRKINFSGRRYKCLICHDFDVCSSCYDRKVHAAVQKHSLDHPMQLVLTANDCEQIYFGQKRSPTSLTCPVCNQNGFSSDLLTEHLSRQHPTIASTVLCPICFIRQSHLAEHLRRHREESVVVKTIAPMPAESNEGPLLNQLVPLPRMEQNDDERNIFIHGLLTHLLGQASL